MSVKEFDKLFGLVSTIDEEQVRFINRVEVAIFDSLIHHSDVEEYRSVFRTVCYHLGLNSNDYIHDKPMIRHTPNFSNITKHEFTQTLRVLVALYSTVERKPGMQDQITRSIKIALESSSINIGVNWKDGLFYPSGDKFLDKELLEQSYDLLKDYPNEQKDIKNAIENYSAKSLYGVVENCYLAIEGLSRKILNNNKTLIDNKNDLLAFIQFSKYWNKILANYLFYANEYRRHASEHRHELKYNEVEAFLYLSCLLIRALILTIKEKV
ncbi:MAG: hypothetical protein WCG45_06200 [bacterium]